MSRFLTNAIVAVLGLVATLHAQAPDAATNDFNAVLPLINEQKFGEVVPKLEEIVKKYPASPIIDNVRLNLGLAYLFDQKYKQAIEALVKVMNPPTQAEVRDGALFFTGLAQAFQGYSLPATDAARKKSLEDAVASFGKHLESKDFEKSLYREEAPFRRAQIYSILENYPLAYKTLDQLLQEFATSPNKADYLLLRGSSQAVQAYKADSVEKKSKAEVMPLVQKALGTFNEIRQDSKFVVVGNDAALQSAELILMVADTPEEWKKAIEEFRQIRTRDELIPIQEELIAQMRKELPRLALAQNRIEFQRVQLQLNKERERLDGLKDRSDPAVQALAQIGSCYLKLKQINEARILLRRARSFAQKEQKKNIAFQVILTYAIQGLTEDANKEFESYQKEYAGDAQADNISVIIGSELMKQKEWQAALEQFQKSMKDYPQGRFIDLAVLNSADCLTKLNKGDEAIKVLQDFVAKNANSDKFPMAQRNLGNAQLQQKKFDDAAKTFKALATHPKAGELQAEAILLTGNCLNAIKKYDEAIAEWQNFRSKFANHTEAATTLYRIGLAQLLKGDVASALTTFEQVAKEYSKGEKSDIAALAVFQMGEAYGRTQKFPEMVAAYERVAKDFGSSPYVPQARSKLAKYYEKGRNYEEAAKHYEAIIALNDPKNSPWGQFNLGGMWLDAAKALGAYRALNEEEKKSWTLFMDKGEKALIEVLKKFPAATEAAASLQSLVKAQVLKSESEVITQVQAEAYFQELAKQFTDPALNIRIQLAGVAVPFEKGNSARALAAYKEILQKNSNAPFSAEDYDRYATALMNNKEYESANAVFKLLEESYPNDPHAQAKATYGQGAALLFQKKTKEAEAFFDKLKTKFPWSDKILEAKLGLGIAAEEAGKSEDALGYYREIIQDQTPKSTAKLKAKATLGRGRIWESRGFLVPDPQAKEQQNAAAEFMKVDSFFENEKEIASEALFHCARVYEKAGKSADARKHYQAVTEKYKGSEWATKAAEKLKTLPAS